MSPINIDAYINNQYVKSYHIGRKEGEAEPDSINTYWIVESFDSEGPDWTPEHSFEHRYGDGIDVCIKKGLEALLDNDLPF